jgi:hypothetical protein
LADLRAEIAAGHQASRVLNDDAFKAAVRLVEAELFEEWRAAETAEGREEIHAAFRGLERVLRRLHATVDSGKVAAAQAERRF